VSDHFIIKYFFVLEMDAALGASFGGNYVMVLGAWEISLLSMLLLKLRW
jgi:hypothetical protein